MVSKFIYPRTVSIYRFKIQDADDGGSPVTLLPYSGVTSGTTDATGEDLILSNLPASIQYRGVERARGETLPTSTPAPGDWVIFIPKKYATLGQITERDIAVDDLGKRYEVVAAWWDSLGYNLRSKLLDL